MQFQLVRNIRVQFYAAIVLAAFGFFTAMHMPQGFYDYVLRCLALLPASFCCIHVLLDNQKLSLPERVFLFPFSALLVLAAAASLNTAFHVRCFSDR